MLTKKLYEYTNKELQVQKSLKKNNKKGIVVHYSARYKNILVNEWNIVANTNAKVFSLT